jgi:hypothetical protein
VPAKSTPTGTTRVPVLRTGTVLLTLTIFKIVSIEKVELIASLFCPGVVAMGRESYFFVGQDRQPSELVSHRLQQEPDRRSELIDLLGELSLDDAYIAFNASPENETDTLTPRLHDYLSKLLRVEYSTSPGELKYSMSMNNCYIIGLKVDPSDRHQSEVSCLELEVTFKKVGDLLGCHPHQLRVYALN